MLSNKFGKPSQVAKLPITCVLAARCSDSTISAAVYLQLSRPCSLDPAQLSLQKWQLLCLVESFSSQALTAGGRSSGGSTRVFANSLEAWLEQFEQVRALQRQASAASAALLPQPGDMVQEPLRAPDTGAWRSTCSAMHLQLHAGASMQRQAGGGSSFGIAGGLCNCVHMHASALATVAALRSDLICTPSGVNRRRE